MITMKLKYILLWFLILLTGLSLSSCKEQVEYQDLEGTWTLIRAMRNGKPTQTLENVFFDFDPGNRMMTNLLGDESSFEIVYNYPNIKVESSSELDHLTVKKMTGDTLHLELRIMNYKYDFFLMRSETN